MLPPSKSTRFGRFLRSRGDLAAQRSCRRRVNFDYGAWSNGRIWRVAGNLPYNIATPLIFTSSRWPRSRIVDRHGTERRRRATRCGGRDSGLWQPLGRRPIRNDVELALTLDPQSFFPPPKVRSSIVAMSDGRAPRCTAHPALFWKVVRAAFAYRRKTLANSCRSRSRSAALERPSAGAHQSFSGASR